MTSNNPEVVTMGDRYPESECYQCGRLKTALSYRSRCLTCETQRADANADENDELCTRLSDYEALQAECNALRAKTSMSIGVGDGTGNLFVHGDYDSIKRVQELIFECEELRKVADKYRRLIELSKFLEKEEWNDAFAQGFNAGFNSDERPAQDVAALLRERAVMVDKIEALETKCWKLAGALELISNTDPDEGTAWFHEIAHKALEAYQQEK